MFCSCCRNASPEPQARRRSAHQRHRRPHRRHELHAQQEPQVYNEPQQYYGHQGPQHGQAQPGYQEHYEQQGHPGYQGYQHREEYELYNLPNLGVRTLQDVGYEVSDPVRDFHPLAGKEMWLYDITYPATTAKTRDNVIAKLGVLEDPSQL